jgi:hypothetical protein
MCVRVRACKRVLLKRFLSYLISETSMQWILIET